MRKDTQINIRLDNDLLEKLRLQADEEVTTTSQLVRKAITYYLRPKTSDQCLKAS
jgi:metal-responsive CopG/Arc/MetJ family transcriptional regulator